MALQDKVVVITGASSGIGALTAQMLGKRGAIPILLARSEDKLKDTAAGIPGVFGLYACDVTDEEQVQNTFADILRVYGRIDVLLNNAGYGKFAAFTDMESREFDDMMDVNYMGIVRCTKAVVPHMLERGSGQIVNVASMAGKIGTARSVAYTATKHAVLGFTNALRQELRRQGIIVSAVNPGPIATEFFRTADPSGSYEKSVARMMMTPEHVSKKIVKLIDKGKEEIDLPGFAAVGIRLYGLFPRLADKLTYNLMNRK
ncbi:SDR family NAD(P)-dependent oxidoreductase [Paenibacillus riograndensis]|uniref:Short-chain dehydrogenase/reductase SDR n=1 Tax=Paenibacillus riograndensis SBR5 TaxID=1073571 RepID=A0A0E4HDD9_9BACL|nr:SDR family oxidoreductase [Paenibacillus riograndensis]CQR58000.1 short-chain dehydrogenase/reductase SDR [Paenibacillus riograndensis SBR5]